MSGCGSAMKTNFIIDYFIIGVFQKLRFWLMSQAQVVVSTNRK